MNRICKNAPIIFKNLHVTDEQIEKAAFSQLCWVRIDPKRAQVYEEEMNRHWKDILDWKKTVDEQMARVKNGDAIERTRLYMS